MDLRYLEFLLATYSWIAIVFCGRRDRREQAAWRGTGVRAGAAGVVSAEPSAGDPRSQWPPDNLEALDMPTKGRPSRKVWQQLRPSETAPAAGCHFNFAQPVSFQPCADMTSDEIAKAMLQIAQIGCAMSRKESAEPTLLGCGNKPRLWPSGLMGGGKTGFDRFAQHGDVLLVAGFQADRIGLQGPGIADFGAIV